MAKQILNMANNKLLKNQLKMKEVSKVITVVGSINMDLIIKVKDVPALGETILGQEFATSPGGKGANQAVAAARLGADVQMVACVGDDVFGRELKTHLHNENINVANVRSLPSTSTGVANVILTNNDNRIIVIPGANYELKKDTIVGLKDTISHSKMVVLQLEILPETVRTVVELCNEKNVPIILNPAPAEHFDKQFISQINYLTPNESECRQIFGMDMEDALEMYPNQLIVTLGKDGAQYYDGKAHVKVPGFPIKALDTTGAGDTFNGALAYALVNQYDLNEAVLFANAAASLSVEKQGAQSGMPGKEDVEKRMLSMGDLNDV
ncbi:ribokinase [Virgibacillus sp. FSP13]